VVRATQRRQAVTHLLAAYPDQCAPGRLLTLARSRWYAPPQRVAQGAPVRQRLRDLAAEWPRAGYRQLHLYLARAGHRVNAKRVYRLYRQEGLGVRWRGRKRVARPRVLLRDFAASDRRFSLMSQRSVPSWKRAWARELAV